MQDISLIIDEYKFNFRVSCLIECRGRYLFCKSVVTNFLNLPGGRVHAGESTQEAVKRELKEEIGIEIKKVKLLKVAEQFFEFDNKKYHEIGFVYYSKLNDKNKLADFEEIVNIDNKNETLIWIDKTKLKNYNILPEYLYDIKNNHRITHTSLNKLKGEKYKPQA